MHVYACFSRKCAVTPLQELNSMHVFYSGKPGDARSSVLPAINRGMTLVELLLTMIIMAILMAMAMPSYFEFIEKRKTTGAVENISSLIVNAKMEAIKRNQPVTVSFLNNFDGDNWCFGFQVGTTTCDCGEDDASAAAYCDVTETDGSVRSSRLYSGDFGGATIGNFDTFSGATNFTFDPILGLLTDTADSGSLEVTSENGKYQVTIAINGAGRVTQCTDSSKKLVGYDTCS
jgi:prepilin-type N-terminal cleavage/methylation domain-containing protein